MPEATSSHPTSGTAIGARFRLDRARPLAPISHERRCIGALNRRKFFCDKALRRCRGGPRCRRSVARRCSRLHLLRAALWWPASTVERSPRMPALCCSGRRIGPSGWCGASPLASPMPATRSGSSTRSPLWSASASSASRSATRAARRPSVCVAERHLILPEAETTQPNADVQERSKRAALGRHPDTRKPLAECLDYPRICERAVQVDFKMGACASNGEAWGERGQVPHCGSAFLDAAKQAQARCAVAQRRRITGPVPKTGAGRLQRVFVAAIGEMRDSDSETTPGATSNGLR